MNDPPLYVMDPQEVAWGYVLGYTGSLPAATDGAAKPREALETVIRRALERPPCGVAFSGGRDSSTVLAVATHVARREGLPEPVPITRTFPGVADAEETEWQEAVIHHLGLRDWRRVRIDDELDLLGPLATRRLVEHGVLWPPTLHGDLPILQALEGAGTLMDGEGGDEVLGHATHRIAPVTRLVRSPRPLRWSRVWSASAALAPAALRSRPVRERYGEARYPWLRPVARQELVETMVELEARRPLPFSASVRMVPLRRTQTLLARNRAYFGRELGIELLSPLLHPDFVHALAVDGGFLGRGDRTAVLRRLVPDLLPDAVLARTSKASFGEAFVARHSLAFAERWSGDGLDTARVDPEVLCRLWRSGARNALTSALLQSAWLATEGRRDRSLSA